MVQIACEVQAFVGPDPTDTAHSIDSHGEVIIRTAKPADADAIATVHVRSWQAAYRGLIPQEFLDGLDPALRAERWNRSLSQPRPTECTLVVEIDGRVLGFANLGPSRDEGAPSAEGELRAIYLEPDQWGTGTGRALMAATLDALGDAAFDDAILWVLTGNERARRFYEAGGWVSDGSTQQVGDFVGVDEIRYRLVLSRT